MMIVEYTHAAQRDLLRLPTKTAQRIVKKMRWFASQKDPLASAKPLRDARFGSHRFRVGDYRILVDLVDDRLRILLVLAVKHRKDVYRVI